MSSQENERLLNATDNMRAHIVTQLSIIVKKKFNENDIRYILNRMDRDSQEANFNETQKSKDKRHSRFMRDMIFHFMPDDDNRQEQLEKLPIYED
jgi:ribosomal protein L13